jgi:hypothetical protein
MIVRQSTINEALGWGSGIGLERSGGRKYMWHWGDNPGFKNFVVGEPATGAAIIIFTNGNAGQRVYERVIRARTGIDHPGIPVDLRRQATRLVTSGKYPTGSSPPSLGNSHLHRYAIATSGNVPLIAGP